MSETRLNEIRTKMKEKRLRTGFTCLFYGGPGTGKTETVYQIARESGRDLFIVDVSKIKSCWVGESEKNMKEVLLFPKWRLPERKRFVYLVNPHRRALIGQPEPLTTQKDSGWCFGIMTTKTVSQPMVNTQKPSSPPSWSMAS